MFPNPDGGEGGRREEGDEDEGRGRGGRREEELHQKMVECFTKKLQLHFFSPSFPPTVIVFHHKDSGSQCDCSQSPEEGL